jgi:ArsR family transcriptional regulator
MLVSFSEIFDITQPSISAHIKKLRNADLINEERKGLWTVYSINRKNVYFPLVHDILNHFPSQKEKLDWLEQKGLRIIY